jgi:GNAT superfamily N-acetyltransferase
MEINTNKLVYKKMGENDLDIFIKLRLDFLSELNKDLTEESKLSIKDSLKRYYLKYLKLNDFIGIICEYNSAVISSAFLAINEKPANSHFVNGRVGTLLNVYTYPEYRKNGIAGKILEIIIKEAKEQYVSEIELMATNDGERLYYKLGFYEPEMKYMKLKI